MTINGNTNYILEHPFLQQAIIAYNRGDDKDLKFILSSIQEDMYHITVNQCAKVYKRFKKETYPIIENEIRCAEPPECLNVKLPIPLKQENCKVVILSPKIKHIKNFKIINQLELEFTYKNKKAPKYIEALVG